MAELHDGFEEVDFLSSLPDDVLSQILSSLSVEEAVRSKLLSQRWRGLYPANPTLRFYLGYSSNKESAENFVARVSKAMQQFRAPKIHAFELKSSANVVKYKRNMDEWVCRAFAMNVERISLLLHDVSHLHYSVPLHLLPGVQLCHLTFLKLWNCWLPAFTSLASPLISLRELHLCSVLSKDNFEDIPSCCPNLETLSLLLCERQLPNMRQYVRQFKCLKSLDLSGLKLDLEIHDANITKFIYFGNVKSISLKGLHYLRSALINIAYESDSNEQVAIFYPALWKEPRNLEVYQ